jgi:hypothetical protein
MLRKATKLLLALVAPHAVSDAGYLNIFASRFYKFLLVGFAELKAYALDVLHGPLVFCIQ